MFKRNLELLLKEKYGYSDMEIFLADKTDLPTSVNKDIKLLEKNYPVDYLIGYKWFLGNKINLSKKPLIPRNETEYWVEKCISAIATTNSQEYIQVLDMFCGSGCIGISILSHIDNTTVVFSDISLNATKQCGINLLDKKDDHLGGKIKNKGKDKFKYVNRWKIIRSNLFDKMKRSKFDYIFANPPYVDVNDPQIGDEIKYEPKEALFALDNGMAVIKEFLKEAKKHLLPNGKIFMEFGYNQKDLIDEYLKMIGIYSNWQFHKDQHQNWRYVEIN